MSGCCQPGGASERGELPKGALRVVLVGRPNAGKSSLFNRLSGGSAHVGNFAGVTVDLLEGRVTLPAGNEAALIDLPGLYALSDDVPEGTDESVARDYLSDAARQAENLVIVQIADSTQLTASLGLFQTVRSKLPQARTLFVASQLDLLERDGTKLAVDKLADEIGSPAIAVNARDEATKASVLAAIEETLRREALAPRSFDPSEVTKACLTRPAAPTGVSPRERSRRIDRVVLHPFFGPLIFLALMALLFSSVFAIADPVAKVCDAAVAWLGKRARDGLGGGLLGSAVADGVLGGAGTVAAFLPQVVLLVAGMELLEASGYLARGAFLVDRLFRVFGLGGKAFVPLLTGHACAVPAITATRVLRDPKERLTTILVLPLMTCSARLPVYGLVIAAFIGGGALRKAAVFTGLYVFAIVAGLFAAVVLRRTVTKGRGLPLALEMPDYRAPQLGAVFTRCFREAKEFLRRVGTVIVVLALLLWAALKIPARAGEEPVEARSVAAAVGHALEPISRPLGFDWRINVGLVASFGARELMVGTFGVIHGVEGADAEPAPLVERMQNAKGPDGSPAYGLPTALSLLVFFVFACQCMSTLSAIRRETKSTKWAAFVLGYTYALAYVASLITFQIARLLTLAAGGLVETRPWDYADGTMSRLDEELADATREPTPGEAEIAAEREPSNPALTVPSDARHGLPERVEPKGNLKLLVGLLVAAVGIVALAMNFREAAVYAKTVDQLMAEKGRLAGRAVRVEGNLVKGSLVHQEVPCEYRFEMENGGAKVPVRYANCVVPDTFRDVPGMDVKVTVEGKLSAESGRFEATQVMAKCPSKYEMKEKAAAGESMPHAAPNN